MSAVPSPQPSPPKPSSIAEAINSGKEALGAYTSQFPHELKGVAAVTAGLGSLIFVWSLKDNGPPYVSGAAGAVTVSGTFFLVLAGIWSWVEQKFPRRSTPARSCSAGQHHKVWMALRFAEEGHIRGAKAGSISKLIRSEPNELIGALTDVSTCGRSAGNHSA
jgi:hypothetical protein